MCNPQINLNVGMRQGDHLQLPDRWAYDPTL